jgi:LytS/YehU family sensor histidine kinase
MAAVWAPLGLPALLYAARFPIRRGRLVSTSLGNLAVGCGTLALYTAITNSFSTARVGYVLELVGDLPFSLQVAGAMIGLGHLLFYAEAVRRTESAAYRLRTELSEAELRMLQMQLQPHFLFNVLNSISALMRRDVAAADRMLRQVGRLLRLALERTGRELVPLREELEFLELYLTIEQTRYQDRLNVRFAVSEAARDFMVPHLILQPLVENAIRHGIAPHPEPSELLVRGDVRGDERLCLEVRDWGAGLHAARPRRPGLGIPATRARLERRYGPAASFEITSPVGGGTRVVVVMPPSPAQADG